MSDGAVDFLAAVEEVGGEPDCGAVVKRGACLLRRGDVSEDLVVGHGGDKGAFVTSATEALMEFGVGCLKEDGGAGGVHHVDIVEEAGCAASAGYDHILKLTYFHKHPALDVAEALLAVAGEDVADVGVVSALDVGVEVDELQSGGSAQRASERGLAAAHESYEEYRFHFPQEGVIRMQM